MNETSNHRGTSSGLPSPQGLLAGHKALVERLFGESQAGRWGLTRLRFVAVLERSTAKRFSAGNANSEQIVEYLSALHLQDLALACACAEGCVPAWEHFVAEYRGYLRAAASAILRCRGDSAKACELADSLFAELYGLADGSPGDRSLFRYFHGRSSLKTWLRAVLAQRHVDAIRAGRRFETLEDGDSDLGVSKNQPSHSAPLADPHRSRYLSLFVLALKTALVSLDARDEERLRWYYTEEQTLAEIGRRLGEHESSVSRNLDRIRRGLRQSVEETLRRGGPPPNGFQTQAGLSDAEIALCFEYAAEDVPFDLERLLQRKRTPGSAAEKREP
jgi:RNA polymerase sigma-70 factor, ECF subfamily